MGGLRDTLRANLLPYSERAFRLLPPLERPRVLDLGCGTGVPSLFLAEITGGHVTAVDRDSGALEALRSEAERRGLAHRVTALEGSVDALSFPDASFDLVWCEGALFVLGFRQSLRRWGRLLRAGGFLVAHDEEGDVAAKLAAAGEEGFDLLGSFRLTEEVWWKEYYGPAAAALAEAGTGAPSSPPEAAELAEEIRRFRQDAASFRSAFFVLQKPET